MHDGQNRFYRLTLPGGPLLSGALLAENNRNEFRGDPILNLFGLTLPQGAPAIPQKRSVACYVVEYALFIRIYFGYKGPPGKENK